MKNERKNKAIVYVVVAAVIMVAIVVALWLSGALKEHLDKIKKEKERQNLSKVTSGLVNIGKVTDDVVLPSIIITENVQIDICESDESEFAEIYNDPTTTAQEETSEVKASYIAKFSIDNSWEGHYQYTVTVENLSSVQIDSWEIKVKVPSGCSVESFWCSDCDVVGDMLVIKPADFNSVIGVGESYDNIGFILVSKSDMTDFECTGEGVASTAPAQTQAPTQAPTQKPSESQPQTNPQPTTSDYDSYTPPVLESGTPLSNHGKLSVKGVNLVDSKGNKFQLKGVSTHGIAWYPKYVNKDAFKTLRDDWGANTIRLAMYTAEDNGYCTGGNQASLKKLVEDGVKYATELGMYVIIDWHVLHDMNPNTYKSQAVAFFNEMSAKYADYDNVIYEICNEPNGGVGWSSIKTYADEVISVIRKNDSDAIILVGTPTWSQDVDQVAANPVKNGYNVMYTLHFYAATHKENIQEKMKTALNAGTPIFVSEFSICDSSGNGGIDYASATKWMELINKYNLSYMGWSLSNKAETSALIKSSCKEKFAYWTTDELSETGKWLRGVIAGK